MKVRSLLFLFILILVSTNINAQLKIGYANIEVILAYMSETQAMNQSLQTFQKKLGDQLKVKEEYSQQKYIEYLELKERSQDDEATLKPLEEELLKLDKEIREFAADSEQKLMAKRQELLEPIVNKLNANLQSLAAEEGYDYILNTVDGSGVSIVLHGPEQHNLTEKLLNRLGIVIPSND